VKAVLTNAPVSFGRKLQDYALLIKLRLNLVVVFSAAMGYILVAGGSFLWPVFTLLVVGGFLVTSAANTFNQVLEKDYDRLMLRTMNRPLASNRMSVSEAVLFGGFSSVIGILMLALINPLTAMLGAISLLSYSFIYTPLKRVGSIAVYVGALPGALPLLIGCAAVNGTITMLGFLLFLIQFVWQFPHFWSIAWLSHEDYSKAGFKLLPSKAKEPRNNYSATFTLVGSVSLLIVSLIPWSIGLSGSLTALFIAICGLAMVKWSVDLLNRLDKASARYIMFGSFLYLPLVLLAFWIERLI